MRTSDMGGANLPVCYKVLCAISFCGSETPDAATSVYGAVSFSHRQTSCCAAAMGPNYNSDQKKRWLK